MDSLDNNSIPQKKAYHHEDLRSALVEAGRQQLAEKGPSGVSLRQVAKMAGVSHTAPYRHFEDKSQLLVAIAQEGYEKLKNKLDEAYESHMGDPVKQLLAAGNAYVEFFLNNQESSHLMFGGYLNSATNFIDVERSSSKAFDSLLRIIVAGKEANLYRNIPARDIGLSVWSMVHGISMLHSTKQIDHVLQGSDDAAEIGRTVANLLLRGLLNPGALTKN